MDKWESNAQRARDAMRIEGEIRAANPGMSDAEIAVIVRATLNAMGGPHLTGQANPLGVAPVSTPSPTPTATPGMTEEELAAYIREYGEKMAK